MAPGRYPEEPERPVRSGRGFTVDPDDRPYYRGRTAEAPRRGWLRLLVAGAVAVGCAGALWFAYARLHGTGSAPGEAPLIRADQGPAKVRPDQPGGETAPEQDKDVYDMGQSSAQVERLLPPPEQPLPRPTAPPEALPTQDVAAPPQPRAVPAMPAAAAPAPAATGTLAAPPGAAAAAAPPPVAASLAPAAKPAPIAVPAAPAPGATGFRVQIAATRDAASAQTEWDRLQHAHGDLLGGLSPAIVKADLGDRGVFYRVQAGPIADHAQAQKLCGQLKALSIGCMVVKLP